MNQLTRIVTLAICVFALPGCKDEVPPQQVEVARPAKFFTVADPGADTMRSFPGEVQATDQAGLAFRVGG